MTISKTARKEIDKFLRDIMILHKLTKEDLKLFELGMLSIYKQGEIDTLKNIAGRK